MVRPGFARAVSAILLSQGVNGKPLSLRQAARLCGLSAATVGELAAGNPRTMSAIRRFAEGLGQDPDPLFMLAGYVPTNVNSASQLHTITIPEVADSRVEAALTQWAAAYNKLTTLLEQELFFASIVRDIHLMRLAVRDCHTHVNNSVSGTIDHP